MNSFFMSSDVTANYLILSEQLSVFVIVNQNFISNFNAITENIFGLVNLNVFFVFLGLEEYK